MIECYFDGACEPRNPGGNMGIGACVHIDNQEVFTHSRFVKAHTTNSNNVAEYMAFEAILNWIAAEEFLQKISGNEIHVYGDSNLVIEQMFGTWKIKGGRYVNIAFDCKKKLYDLKKKGYIFHGEWIPREQNSYADELSKRELINHKVQFRIQPRR